MLKIILSIVFFSNFLFASVGKITSMEGKASISRDGTILVAVVGGEIEKKDLISTQTNSKVKITLMDNTIVTIGKESVLNIEEYVFDEAKADNSVTELNFVKGAFHTITGQIGKINPSKFKLKTKSASIGIRGTEIYSDDRVIACTSGTIDVVIADKVFVVPSGYYIDINNEPLEVKFLDEKVLEKVKDRLIISNDSDKETITILPNQSIQESIRETVNQTIRDEVEKEAQKELQETIRNTISSEDVAGNGG